MEKMLDEFFHATASPLDWEAGEPIWRVAGRAFQNYVERRKRGKEELPRRILADFFIAAHAALDRYSLITLDQRLYRAAYPKLEILTF